MANQDLERAERAEEMVRQMNNARDIAIPLEAQQLKIELGRKDVIIASLRRRVEELEGKR